MKEKLSDKHAQIIIDDIAKKSIVSLCLTTILEDLGYYINIISQKGHGKSEILENVRLYLENELENVHDDGQKVWKRLCEHRDKCEHEFKFLYEVPNKKMKCYACRKCGKQKYEKIEENDSEK